MKGVDEAPKYSWASIILTVQVEEGAKGCYGK